MSLEYELACIQLTACKCSTKRVVSNKAVLMGISWPPCSVTADSKLGHVANVSEGFPCRGATAVSTNVKALGTEASHEPAGVQ